MTHKFLRLLSFATLLFLLSPHSQAQITDINAALQNPEEKGIVYLFQGSQYYRYDLDQDNGGIPKDTRSNWSGIPSKIDAAVENPKDANVVYLFSGSQYYKFDWAAGKVVGGAKSISGNWPGLPSRVDAAVRNPKNTNDVYFFSGSNYYKFSWSDNKVVGGTKSISGNWPRLPSLVNAALINPKDPNQLFFFAGKSYYRFNWSGNKVDADYPKNTSQHWKSYSNEKGRDKALYYAPRLQEKVSSLAGNHSTLTSLNESEWADVNSILGEDLVRGYAANEFDGSMNIIGGRLQFYVVESNTRIFIVFRGSSSGNWANNFCTLGPNPDFDMVMVPVCYGDLAKSYFQMITGNTQFKGKSVSIIGHSQGGAIAAHLTYLFVKNGTLDRNHPHHLITIGAPRFGVKDLRDKFNSYVNRNAPKLTADALETDGDIVPHALDKIFVFEPLLPFGSTHKVPCHESSADAIKRHTDMKYIKAYVDKRK